MDLFNHNTFITYIRRAFDGPEKNAPMFLSVIATDNLQTYYMPIAPLLSTGKMKKLRPGVRSRDHGMPFTASHQTKVRLALCVVPKIPT